jgi:hypothetical protein
MGKDLKEGSCGLIEVISRDLSGRSEENHDKLQPEYPVLRPRLQMYMNACLDKIMETLQMLFKECILFCVSTIY